MGHRPAGPAIMKNRVLVILGLSMLAWGAAPAAWAAEQSTAHIENGTVLTRVLMLTDGGKCRWNIQPQGNLDFGIENTFRNTAYAVISVKDQERYFPGGKALIDKSAQEIELQEENPNRNSLRYSRRLRVYNDRPFARWLEIMENGTSQPAQIQLRLLTNFSQGITEVQTSSNQSAFTNRDYALIAQAALVRGQQSAMSYCHIFCEPMSKVRPSGVTVQGQQLEVRWNLLVPAGGTAIVCHFQSMSSSADMQRRLIKSFRYDSAIRDLPRNVRKWIVNSTQSDRLDMVAVDRSATSDRTELIGGDPLYGTILNNSFPIATPFGLSNLPAERVVGCVALHGEDGVFQFLLSDGQVVTGRADSQILRLRLPAGTTLEIPFEQIRQWAFRCTADKPDELPEEGVFLVTRRGDRLAFNPEMFTIAMQTRYGDVTLTGRQLSQLILNEDGRAGHHAVLRNGTILDGLALNPTLKIRLLLHGDQELSTDTVRELVFTEALQEQLSSPRWALADGRELFGPLAGFVTLRTAAGEVELTPAMIKRLSFTPSRAEAVVSLWNSNTNLRGELSNRLLPLELADGLTIQVPAGEIEYMETPFVPLSKEQQRQARQWIEDLASPVWKTREDATQSLINMGLAVVPLLQDRLDDGDLEVRRRAERILEQIQTSTPDRRSTNGPQLRPIP